jgi:hypothetical protein
MDLSVLLCFEGANTFQQMHRAYIKANDPLTFLESKKIIYRDTFITFCEGAKTTTGLAALVGNELKAAIKKSVCYKAKIELAREIRSNMPPFKGNRSNLEAHILKRLATEENFKNFKKYIHMPKDFFEEYIDSAIEQYCWTGSEVGMVEWVGSFIWPSSKRSTRSEKNKDTRLLGIIRSCLQHFKDLVLRAINLSSEAVASEDGKVPMWLDLFCENLKEHLAFTRQDLKCLEFQEITDIKFLQDAMCIVLDQVVKDLENVLCQEETFKEVFSLTEVRNTVLNNLCGCWVQCPFCKAICTNTIHLHDGDHSVEFHRPNAVNGGHWRKTDTFVTDICSSLIGTDLLFSHRGDEDENYIPYKEYRTAGPKYACWSITPDTSVQPYWKWFVCTFQSNLEKQYKYKFEDRGLIPEGWKTITKTDAIESLTMAQ